MRALYDDDIDRMRQDVMGTAFTDQQVVEAIGRMHKESGYLLDPHGAIAWLGLQEALQADRDAVGVFLATAHPAKFREVVEPAIGEPVALPSALAEALARPRHSIHLAANYPALLDLVQPKSKV
jgi:threonine synthase